MDIVDQFAAIAPGVNENVSETCNMAGNRCELIVQFPEVGVVPHAAFGGQHTPSRHSQPGGGCLVTPEDLCQ